MSNQEVLDEASRRNLNVSAIDTKNKRRLIRLIETGGKTSASAPIRRPNTLLIGVERTKQEITQRIAQRIEQMIEEGLVGEVESLADKYGWKPRL
jgi:tRNA A37 N6-isopentenylltransferase MiaA